MPAAFNPDVQKIRDALELGLASDIWYDAHDHNDEGAEAVIEATQVGMNNANSLLLVMEHQRIELLNALEALHVVLHPGVVGLIGNHHGEADGARAIAAVYAMRAAIRNGQPTGSPPMAMVEAERTVRKRE